MPREPAQVTAHHSSASGRQRAHRQREAVDGLRVRPWAPPLLACTTFLRDTSDGTAPIVITTSPSCTVCRINRWHFCDVRHEQRFYATTQPIARASARPSAATIGASPAAYTSASSSTSTSESTDGKILEEVAGAGESMRLEGQHQGSPESRPARPALVRSPTG